MFIGNSQLVEYFEQLAKRQAWAQAYCLVGPGGVGKLTLVKQIGASLLQTDANSVTKHPDFSYLDKGVDEKSGKPRTEIPVAHARAFRANLQNKSLAQGWRLAVINEAESLSIEAANSLLKIVEEPPERTVIFFLAERPEAVPQTILSRTEILYFKLVPEPEIAEGLKKSGVAEASAKQLAAQAWGRPGRAKDLAQAEVTDSESTAQQFVSLLNGSVAEQSAIIAGLTEKKDAERVSENVALVIDEWLMETRKNLRESIKNSNALEQNRLINLADGLHAAKDALKKNINPRLLLENIFFSL